MSDDRLIALRFPVVVCLAVSAWADGRAGVDAYKRRNYATALREWRPLAEQGDANAPYNLGVMYDFAKDVPQDFTTARWWYEKADAQPSLGCRRRHFAAAFSLSVRA